MIEKIHYVLCILSVIVGEKVRWVCLPARLESLFLLEFKNFINGNPLRKDGIDF